MDEPRFVRLLEDWFPFSHGMGIGDDTSVVKTGDGFQLITKDLFIQDVHFSLDYYTLEAVAYKSLAVNLSDIAAMGGTPRYFYLGLGVPPSLKDQTEMFFAYMERACRYWNIQLAGGDFSSAAKLFISITMIGDAEKPILRSTAQTGDLIGITGVTGESAIGLSLLLRGERKDPLIEKHKLVQPELDKGLILAKYVNAMIDVSDGLSIDLQRVLTASGKSARIRYENIPVTPHMRQICSWQGLNEYEMVLAGGEDYVLLFTVSREMEKKLKKENIQYYIIGEIDDEVDGSPGGLTVTHDGKPVQLKAGGWDHFSSI